MSLNAPFVPSCKALATVELSRLGGQFEQHSMGPAPAYASVPERYLSNPEGEQTALMGWSFICATA